MSITPSIPVLRGSKDTDLRALDEELILRRAHQEYHIPLAAIALVHAERRAVEVRLTAPTGTAPTVYRIEDVSEAAATAFAESVNAVLPPAAEGAAAVDGSTLVTTRTVEREPETPREAFRRRVKWFLVGSVLAIVAMSVLVSVVVHPVMMIFVWISGGVGFPFAGAVASLTPSLVERWRLPRHGITVTADYAHIAAEPSLYLYADLDGHTRTYFDTSGRLRIEISYDPRDPSKVVRADGKGRWGQTILLLMAGGIALLALVAFFATPFMDPGV
ncbi:hypothetical protein GCM10020367_05040 [Streptomyces sannanensis]|uniref:DUF3592 domain-containing protein n=1 Tax=Streptomyces sannanensis TaxID=285536 RepID=A0ABP6S4K3_9ACTN